MDSAYSSVQSVGAKAVASLGNNTAMYVLFVIVIMITLYVVVQLYNIVVKTDLRTAVIVKDVIDIKQKGKNNAIQLNKTADGEKIELPTLNNGNEYSISYWMFIEHFPTSTQPKLIMYGGSSLSSAGIIMYMDPSYVKMHLLVKAKDVLSSKTSLSEIHTSLETSCDYFRATVPYVPMNRWVNVSVVIDNNYIQLFIDGELRQVIDTTENYTTQKNTLCENISLSQPSIGDFYSGAVSGGEILQGFISKMKFFNYALTVDHAKMVYKTGPVHQSILAKVGLPLYGIRNPFYRVDADDDKDDNEDSE